jgi:hypothetical protein
MLLAYMLPIFPKLLEPPDSEQYHSLLRERSYIEYARMPSLNQHEINQVVIIATRKGPGVLMNVLVLEHCALNN